MKTLFTKSGRSWLLGLACLSALLVVSSTAVFSITDTDGDGLSDADEVNIFNTDPNKFDTDGDGMGDGDEIRAGTDPLNPLSVFKLLGPLEKIAGGWRVKWQSIPGRIYQIQRAASDQLNTTNWTEIGQVTAAGLASSFDDAFATNGQRFYRVTLETVAVASYYQGNPDRFVPLNAQNQPIESGLIPLNPDGSLTAFEFRPAGRSLAGSAQGFFIRFPNGAKVVDVGGVQYFQFTLATAGFGANSPFQLKTPLSMNGPIAHLPVGEVDVANVSNAFGVQATNGLEVQLFGRFPLRIVSGVFDDTGLRGGKISSPDLNLPLPGFSGAYPGFVIDLTPKGGLRIPFAGKFSLPDGSAFLPEVTVATNRPLWVEFKANGGLGVGGRADVQFPNGPSLSVDFAFDDPDYHLQVTAGKIHVPLLDSLSDLLPPSPTVANTADAGLLDAARVRVGVFDEAMLRFSASVVGAAPAGIDSQPGTPSEAFATSTSVLEAWALAAESAAGPLSPLALRFALKHASQSAGASRDLQTVVCQQATLMRLQHAMVAGFLSNDANVATELTNALAEARTVVLQRAKSADAVRSLDQMLAVMRCLLEVDRSRQLMSLPVDTELIAAESQLLNRFLVALAQTQGIAAGVYQAPPGSTVAEMNRFVATEFLRQIAEVVRLAQLLGLEIEPGTPLNELKMQFALRGWAAVQSVLLSAEAAGDYAAFTTALEDALEIAALNQSGFFPNVTETSQLPGAGFLSGLPARLESVLVADLAKPVGERSLNNQRRDLRRLVKILRELPGNFSYNPAPVQRAFDRLETTLNQSMIVISTFALPDLVTLLDAGIVHAELRDRFNLPAPVSWETARLPQVVSRIATVAQQTNGWSELHDAIAILLLESDRLATNNNQTRRQLYLAKAAELDSAARVVASALWQSEKTRRNANPLLQLADMVLPGDVFVDRVAGSVRYNRQSREVAGAFSGQLRLPKFDLSLTLDNASIRSGGEFDLNAYGQVGLPPNGTFGTLSIPARRPLKISFHPPNSLKFSAGAKLALNNGMSFEAYTSIDDPNYQFGFSAAGLKFDLATNVFGYIPVPDTAALSKLGPDLRLAMSDYFDNLSAAADSLSSLTDPPQFANLGEPPDFSDSIFTISTDPLNAAARGIVIVIAAPVVLGYVAADATAQQIKDATTPVVEALVRDLNRESKRAKGDLDRARNDFVSAAGAAREEVRKVLVRKLLDGSKGLSRIVEASKAVIQKQAEGKLVVTPGVDPGQSQETRDMATATDTALAAVMSNPPPTVDIDVEIGLMNSLSEFFVTQEQLGSSQYQVAGMAQNFYTDVKARLFASYGMNEHGVVTNLAFFNSVTRNEQGAAAVAVSVAKLDQVLQQWGVAYDPNDIRNAYRAVLVRKHAVVAEEIKQAKARKYPVALLGRDDVDALRQEALQPLLRKQALANIELESLGIDDAVFTESYDGTPGNVSGLADYANTLDAYGTSAYKIALYATPGQSDFDIGYKKILDARQFKEKLGLPNPYEQAVILGKAMASPNVPPAIKQSLRDQLNTFAKSQFQEVQSWASSPTVEVNLRAVEAIARDLVGLARLLEKSGETTSPSGPVQAGLRSPRQANLNQIELDAFKVEIFPKFTARITVLADAQKAWWIAGRASRVFLEGLAGKATNDFTTIEAATFRAAQDTLNVGGQILTALRNDVRLQNRPIDLKLPGDVEVEKVFGDLFFNRLTGEWKGGFGGRVEFPDLNNAFFEITSATIDNNLHFTIEASTEGPLPFGGVTIGATVNASGGPGLPFNFQGTGTMSITNGPNVMVDVNWAGATRTLSFDSQVGNLQSLRFTDNLVLFDAGFGLTIRPQIQGGELRANGSAGLFSKGALPASPTQANFHLFADNIQAVLAYQPGQVGLIFSNGTLHLPTFFYPTNMAVLCPGGGPATGPSIALNPANPIQATFTDGSTPSVSFSGELDFRQFGLAVPGIPGLAAAICNAQLKFSSSELPYLTNVRASLQVPLPRSTNFVDFENGVFTLTGYPSGRVELRNDLTMLDVNGFKFTLLGQGNTNCPIGSGFTVFPSSGFNQIPAFKLDGGLRVDAPLSMLTGTNGDHVSGLACGSLTMTNGLLPDLVVNTLAFGGTFHLGSGGPVIKNALVSLQDLPNLFRLDDQHQFLVRLEGGLQIPNGPEFTLQDARFSFFDPERLPRFSVASVGVNNENFTMLNKLPAKVKQATLAFKAPLAEVPYLLSPTNINLTFSAEIRFPATGEPILVGAVDKVEIDFDNNLFPRVKQIDGFEMGVGGFKLPPIKEMGGRLKIGGLSAEDPSRIYMIGRLGGSYQGYQVIGQVAFNLYGPLGFCIDVNAGGVGIPVGPSGILITGASGGESFVNGNGDPCNFKTYFTTNAAGEIIGPSSAIPPGAAMGWEGFRDVVQRMEAQAAVFTQNVPGLLNRGQSSVPANPRRMPTLAGLDNTTTVNLPCPGDCPPATVNLFCQPHPDQILYPGKVIAKFSSINEATLNDLGITSAFIQGLGSDLSSIAGSVAHTLRVKMASLTPPPDPGLLPPAAVAALGNIITNTLDTLETSFSNLCRATLAAPVAGETAYNAIKRLVYEGIPCPDVTMAVSGNVSYAGISTVAYISGKGILSTAGAAGVIGTVYVMGIPLGEGRVFVTATDAQGNPNPSLCGQVTVGFGPLDIGEVKLSYDCPGCVTGVLGGFANTIGALSETVLNRITAVVAPDIAAQNLGSTQLVLALGNLSNQRKLAFFAQLASEPLSALPPNLPQVFFQGIANTYDAINPTLVACGQVAPKIFGLSLGSDLVGVKLFTTKEEVAGSFDFAPSAMLSPFGPFVPLGDKATLTFSLAIRDAYKFIFGGLAGGFAPESAAGYVESAVDYMLQNTSFGIAFDFSPFGFKTASAAARVVIPNLTSHPVLPWSNWVRPEDRGDTNLPPRHDLVLAAIASEKLGDAVNWRGTTNDLYTVYPVGSPQRTALTGLSLQKDYFPHGGFVGGALLTLPAALTEKPPLDKFAIVADAGAAPLDRVLTAIDLIQNYFLRFNTNGELAFYIPAPNPPAFYAPDGQLVGQAELQSINASLTPQKMLESVRSFSIANLRVGSFYPIEQAFIRGYLDGELLGVPIVHADVLGLPADAQRSEGFLSVTSSIPNGSWLQQFIPQASLIFDMRGLPPEPIEKKFTRLAAQLQAAVDTNANASALGDLAGQALMSITADLPKVQLTADLQVALAMPAPIADISHFNGTAQLHAFSPRYEPGYETNNMGPLARVRREGGIAFQGSLSLRLNGADIANIPNAELSAVPKSSGLPALSGQFIAPVIALPGLSLNNWLVDFASDPAPHFTAAGAISGLGVNLFNVQPLTGGSLTGRVDVAGVPPNMSASLALSSSQLILPSIYSERILIHGATRNDPFTFSTTGPWNATLELTNNLTLGVGGVNFVSLGSGGLFSPITFAGNGTSSGSFTIGFGPGAGVTLFPGDATLQRTINFSAGITGSLTVNSDATFLLTTTLGGSALNFNGIDVPAGANLSVSNNGVSITWFINNGATMATLSIGADKQVVFSGSAELPPLDFGVFQITGANGGNLSGSFNNDGFSVSGAKVTLLADWLNNQSVTLNTFTYSNNGGILVSASASGANLTLAGFPFDLTAATFQRMPTNAGGVATLALGGTLHSLPNFQNFPSVNFTGQVSSAGAVFLQSASATDSFFNFPVQRLTNTFTLAAGQFVGQLKSEFQLGATTGLWTALGSNWFTGVLNPDGSMSLNADGPTNTVAGFGLDSILFRFNRLAGQNPSVLLEGGFALPGFTKFRLKGGIDANGGIFLTPAAPAPAAPIPYPNLNAQVSVLLTNSGVQVSGVLNQPPLQSLSLIGAAYTSGAFSLTGSVASATIAGYGLNNLTVILDRAAGGVANVQANAKLTLADFSGLVISGGFTNNGTFGLFASLPSYTIVGLPVPTLTSGTLGWTHNGVSLAGTLTGGVLTKVLPTATVSGAIAFSTTGAKTLSGTASIAPITSDLFRLLPVSGGDFTFSLNNNGLTLPGGALFEFSNFLTSGLAVPEFTLATDGSFSVNVGVPSPLSFTLRNFSLDNVTFSLLRDAAGNLTVPTFGGSLTVPRLNVPVTVNGSWANNGTYNLIGSIGGAVNLSTLGLPVSGLNGGASVSFNQTSLTVSGNLNGPIFSTLPGAEVVGALTVTPSSVTLGGSVSVPSLTLGAFSIQPVGGGPISALWTNSGVVFPANLRLFYNGASAGTFNLPAFTNAPNGDFTLIIPSSAPVTFSIGTGAAAWSLNNAYFTLRRVGGVVSIPTFNAQVTVPGFTTSPVISVSGSLSSDGSFSLANTFALSGPLNAVGSSFGALALASLNFDNTSLRVGGTLSGGALGNINSGVTVSGSIRVTTSGQLFPSGTVTFPDLQLPDVSNGFRLLPLSGANFSATLNETGVVMPAGARLFWRGSSLGSFTLPSFTIPSGGNFSVGFNGVSLGLEGFALDSVSATLARSAGTTTLTVGGPSILNVPGFANLDVNVSGTVTNNGTFLLTGSFFSAAFPGGFPVSTLSSADASFARNSGGSVSLRLTGDVSGGAITGSSADDLRLVSASATVDVSSAGTLAFIGSLQVRSFSVLNFFIEGNWPTNNGVITATLDNNNLTLSGARLRSTVAGLFPVNIALPSLAVPFNGEFSIPVSPPNMTIWGYSITGINFNLRRVAPNVSGLRMFYMDNFAGNLAGSLAATGFGQRFSGGYIFPDGGTDLAWYGALTVDGFTTSSASGYVHMIDNTVYAGGSFNLFAMNRAFNGQFQFDGSVDKNASYTLTGSGSLSIANIEMPTASLTFNNGKITGSPTLKFGDGSGKLDFTPSNFTLTQAAGVSFSHSIGFNQSITIANSVSIASLNVNANLSASGGNSGQVRVTGSASAFGFNLPNLDFGVGSDLEFVLNFGPNCVNFDLAPVRAKFCGAAWP